MGKWAHVEVVMKVRLVDKDPGAFDVEGGIFMGRGTTALLSEVRERENRPDQDIASELMHFADEVEKAITTELGPRALQEIEGVVVDLPLSKVRVGTPRKP